MNFWVKGLEKYALCGMPTGSKNDSVKRGNWSLILIVSLLNWEIVNLPISWDLQGINHRYLKLLLTFKTCKIIPLI